MKMSILLVLFQWKNIIFLHFALIFTQKYIVTKPQKIEHKWYLLLGTSK